MNLTKLNKPYPYTGNFKASVKTFVLISGFIFFFVFLFRSDQLTQNASYSHRLLVSFYFGLITFLGASFNTLILRFFISTKEELKWKVWNEILLYGIHFFTISISVFFLTSIVTHTPLEFSVWSFIKSVSSTIIIGLIPVTIHVLNEQKTKFKKYYELASKLNPEIVQRKIAQTENTLTLNSKSYPVSDILFAESNKNYVELTTSDDKTVSIRITIKELENKLTSYPQFIRCHRAFIVNTDKINNVEGNAQGLKLFLDDFSSYVPVSRSFIPKVDHIIRPNK